MRVEIRLKKLPNGDTVPRGLCCIAEDERESALLDAVFGNKVKDGDGLISESTCECRLSDGYGEHYIYIAAPESRGAKP